MKGIELPINILVIIAVAVIVLLGVIALYFSGFMGPAGLMSQQSAKTKYCAMIMRTPNGCTVGTKWTDTITTSDFDSNRDGTVLATLSNWCWANLPNDPATPCGAAVATCGSTAIAGTDNLAALLTCYYGITKESDALKACGCA